MDDYGFIDEEQVSELASPHFVRVWLMWMHRWFMWSCGAAPAVAQDFLSADMPRGGRALRRRTAHFQRCTVPAARNLATFRPLIPRGYTPTQTLEFFVRISGLGRVRLYRLSTRSCVLRRRALLVCYDHGWWRAPVLRLPAAILRPP